MSLFWKMNKNHVIILFTVVWAVLTIFTLTWGVTVNWPDNLHVNYGLPLVWGTHALNTIAGPVDKWRVDPSTLFIDLIFWLGILVIVEALMLYLWKR